MDAPAREDDATAFPTLSAEMAARLIPMSAPRAVSVGDVLFSAGDRDYDFFYLESAEVDIVRGATPDAPAEVVGHHGSGRFLGELNMLTGQSAYLTALVSSGGIVHAMTRERFRLLMAQDPELSDVILRAFMARRESLRAGAGARSVEIVGSALSPAAHALRNWAARQQLPHMWFDVDDPEGVALAAAVGATADELPVVVTPTATLRRATPGQGRRESRSGVPAGVRSYLRRGRGGCGSGRSRCGCLRRVRGVGHDPVRRGSGRRAGSGQRTHRELSRLPVWPGRSRPHQPCLDPGA